MAVKNVRFVTPGTGAANKAVILDANGSCTIPGTLTVSGGTNGTNGSLAGAITTSNAQIATNTNQKIGFWGVTPVIQPSGTGELIGLLGNAATAANATNMNSNGNSGTTAYTLNDIVKGLKAVGILKA